MANGKLTHYYSFEATTNIYEVVKRNIEEIDPEFSNDLPEPVQNKLDSFVSVVYDEDLAPKLVSTVTEFNDDNVTICVTEYA